MSCRRKSVQNKTAEIRKTSPKASEMPQKSSAFRQNARYRAKSSTGILYLYEWDFSIAF